MQKIALYFLTTSISSPSISVILTAITDYLEIHHIHPLDQVALPLGNIGQGNVEHLSIIVAVDHQRCPPWRAVVDLRLEERIVLVLLFSGAPGW